MSSEQWLEVVLCCCYLVLFLEHLTRFFKH